ncbi:flagellar motor protein MotB [Parageobacillus thermoglucosidasius]|uniref:flagellar motor protein MotB n=1 Tax=Parageobacillus thermoglucosidasius TaxID=1426 RepID=UPI000B560513|nr:flagellar motor protein MotB [Parageobacillus thermoglucosidasius]MBY6267685.1 flagellar motor protein MotB [Parageobacillus thermoglucosidasius]OUM93526.1 MAG: flagellar motor protein MotB [Parageobacillus thermoglucosidasius]
MNKKKKQKHGEHINESWLIPYSDLLTLLLALFIVLFASSQIDQKKFAQIAQSFNAAFTGGTGVLEFQAPIEPEPLPSQPKLQNDQQNDNKKKIDKQEKEELHEVQEKIDTYIVNERLNGKLKTSLTEEGLAITILNDILFDSGSAEVRPQDRQLAKEISQMLVMNPPRNIIISGHTDNVPIHNAQFSSNWELSVMRAVNFMKLLLENPKLDPRLFSAKGYGEFKPVASNDTPEGRMKNRRVEILILPNSQASQQ